MKRIKTPTLIQMEATECGAVALGIVMAYYGKYISIEELRLACGVSRNGSDAYNMVEAAKNYGFDCSGYSVDIDSLSEMKMPVILFWKFNHFVVLEGIQGDQVFINDPATGPRTISYNDFDQSFTGVVITLQPSESFVKSGEPYSLFDALLERVKSVKKPLFFAFLVGLGLLIPNLAFPAFTRVFIDQILINRVFDWQKGIIVGMLIAIIGVAFLNFLQGSVLNRLQTGLFMRLQTDAFWHMLRLPLMFYTLRYPGELASRLMLNDSITRTITGNLATTVINLIFVVVYGIVILYYNVIIALTAMFMMAITILCMRLAYRARSDAYACFQADQGKSIAYSLGALEDIESIKASGMESKFFSRWAGYYTKVANVLQEVGKKDIFLAILLPLLNAFTTLTLIGIGIWQVLHGQMTIGMFVALQILLKNFTSPIIQLATFSQSLQLLKVDMARIDDMMKHPIDVLYKDEQIPIEFNRKLSQLTVENITFGYSQLDPPILENISFVMEPGKAIGLVGPTGCGKSTIARLLGGLFSPWSGNILFDGLSRDQLSRKQCVSSLSLVEQNTFLFEGTVKENLTFFDPTIDQDQMIQAAKDACIHEIIISQPGGYERQIKENGNNFSGGEKQRLEIARALIRKPTILILDEATSMIDAMLESEILQNIKRRGFALLIISHRISAIRNCNEILLLEKGKIRAKGTHEELTAQSSQYSSLLIRK